METKKYSFWIGLRKMAINLLVVGAPLLMGILPTEWMNMTLSGAILLVINYAKVKYPA